jgi:hypothetical protein
MSSRLETGIGFGKRWDALVRECTVPSSLPWSLPLPRRAGLTDELSERARLAAFISRAVAMSMGAGPFRSCCASPSFSVMITKKRSTPLGEIQGHVCVSITLRSGSIPIVAVLRGCSFSQRQRHWAGENCARGRWMEAQRQNPIIFCISRRKDSAPPASFSRAWVHSGAAPTVGHPP